MKVNIVEKQILDTILINKKWILSSSLSNTYYSFTGEFVGKLFITEEHTNGQIIKLTYVTKLFDLERWQSGRLQRVANS